jgi:hypothetical protein
MAELAASIPQDRIGREAYKLYEAFRWGGMGGREECGVRGLSQGEPSPT